MALTNEGTSRDSRFAAYMAQVAGVLGHADRMAPFRAYCLGLLQPGRRKSAEAIAQRLDPLQYGGAHQSLHHFVANAEWSDALLLRRVRETVLSCLADPVGECVWFVVECAFRKKGGHSVGVARQYSDALGRYENCRIAISLAVTRSGVSLPTAFRLFLPRDWAGDAARRAKTGVPADVVFKTRAQIAREQIEAALAEGGLRGVVHAEASFGAEPGFRADLADLGLSYVAAVKPSILLSAAGPEATARQLQPSEASRLAAALPETMRRLSDNPAASGSRFAAVRVRTVAPTGRAEREPEEEWLLIEWRVAHNAPSYYWLSNLPADVPLSRLVDIAKLRAQVDRDYRRLRDLGLDRYEGRGWKGFHHHAALCIAAYGFLLCEPDAATPIRAA